jgi:hypothetical protein
MIGVFFLALIAFGHLLRLLLDWSLVIGDRVIPMWPSGVVVVVFGALSVMIWREGRRE